VIDKDVFARQRAYGLTGSITFSKISSTLAVYCLIWSSGLEYVGWEASGGWMRVCTYEEFMFGNWLCCCCLNMIEDKENKNKRKQLMEKRWHLEETMKMSLTKSFYEDAVHEPTCAFGYSWSGWNWQRGHFETTHTLRICVRANLTWHCYHAAARTMSNWQSLSFRLVITIPTHLDSRLWSSSETKNKK